MVPPSTLSDHLHAYNISKLTVGTRKIIYRNDFNRVPFYENQLGVLQECGNLADLWGLLKTRQSPINPSRLCTRSANPSPKLRPDSTQPSPPPFSSLKNIKLWIKNDSSQNVRNKQLHNLSGDKYFSKTPENTETLSVDNPPKKRKI